MRWSSWGGLPLTSCPGQHPNCACATLSPSLKSINSVLLLGNACLCISLPYNSRPFLLVPHFGAGKRKFSARLGGLSLISHALLTSRAAASVDVSVGVMLTLKRTMREGAGRLFAGSLLDVRPDAFCFPTPWFLSSPPSLSNHGSPSYFHLLSPGQPEPIGVVTPKHSLTWHQEVLPEHHCWP